MEKILEILLCIGAVLISGLICSFFVILNEHKEEIWEKIKNDK